MFLNSKLKSTAKVFWWIMSILIIISMVLLYSPGLFPESQPTTYNQPEEIVAPEPVIEVTDDSGATFDITP